ncbi:uncharacterized protein LOC111696779 isoform X2 [Eurytemora carolleeae]|uniref:uncharacterized protein LOC111696779 isoform X2 n=1 Tax=Eurytemora carolleeae TaxID=1294199 RepID=UPI000C76CEBB|nr:uncharacterized protein LOC111696779 isoform X2 [Eurytemora carolleeae]|eukprot:XP_023322273.1 uncharacterized protein LOC111696779 isoform X2 [Eurytemora affinis]
MCCTCRFFGFVVAIAYIIIGLVALVSFTTSGMNDDKLVDDIVSIVVPIFIGCLSIAGLLSKIIWLYIPVMASSLVSAAYVIYALTVFGGSHILPRFTYAQIIDLNKMQFSSLILTLVLNILAILSFGVIFYGDCKRKRLKHESNNDALSARLSYTAAAAPATHRNHRTVFII